jgi:hypothetical protein
MSNSAPNEEGPWDHRDEELSSRGSDPIALAVSGDSVIGRILALLLRGSGYDARFLPDSSLDEPGALEGVRLLLLTPTPQLSTERRETLLAPLRGTPGATKMPVLELVYLFSKEAREERARDERWHTVPWPCRIEELERRIEAILSTVPELEPAARQEP